jgi:type IV secretory pathway VirD2 relaxase
VAHIQFIVLKRKGKWAVKSVDQERFFSSQREALHAAIELANDYGKEGKPSVVLLQKAKNKFDTIWTYGESAFPPSKSDVPALSEAS